jgi:hypothetical protein
MAPAMAKRELAFDAAIIVVWSFSEGKFESPHWSWLPF